MPKNFLNVCHGKFLQWRSCRRCYVSEGYQRGRLWRSWYVLGVYWDSQKQLSWSVAGKGQEYRTQKPSSLLLYLRIPWHQFKKPLYMSNLKVWKLKYLQFVEIFGIIINRFSASRGGLEVECLLYIQLKAGHYCLVGSNPAWGDYTHYKHVLHL